MKKNIKNWTINILGIIIGAMIMAFGISMFLLPNKLSTGGFTGISTIGYYLFNIPMGIINFTLNVPLFIFATFKIGKKFLAKSVIGMVSLSVFLDLFEKLTPLTNDRFLACIYGGIIVGFGTAIILKFQSSTGGSDLISNIVNKYNSDIKMSNVIVIIDCIVVGLNILVFKEIEIGLYSAIAIYLMGKIIDIIFEGIYFTKLIFIVSNKNEEISKEVGNVIKKGSTGLYGKGMYTKEDKLILMCAASRRDVIRVKTVAKKIDPQAFIIITNAKEVFGLGFK